MLYYGNEAVRRSVELFYDSRLDVYLSILVQNFHFHAYWWLWRSSRKHLGGPDCWLNRRSTTPAIYCSMLTNSSVICDPVIVSIGADYELSPRYTKETLNFATTEQCLLCSQFHVYSIYVFTLRASCGAVYCNRSCLCLCVWVGMLPP